MGLCPDLLRLIVSFLPIQQIYPLLLELGDFTNEWFWRSLLLRDYPEANLEQGLKITHSYAKLYQKYYQFRDGTIGNDINAFPLDEYLEGKRHLYDRIVLAWMTYGNYPHRLDGPIHPHDIQVLSSTKPIMEGDVLVTMITNFSKAPWNDNGRPIYKYYYRLYVYRNSQWLRLKKIKMIDHYNLAYFGSWCNNHRYYYNLDLTSYLAEIRQNQRDRGCGEYYLSNFTDWRGVKYLVAYSMGFHTSLPQRWQFYDFTDRHKLEEKCWFIDVDLGHITIA